MKKQIKTEYQVQKPMLLLEFLYQNIHNKSKNTIKSLLKNGQVFVNDKKQTKFDFPLKQEDKITVQVQKIENSIPFPILYEDHELIVINKPAGLLTISTEKEKQKTVYHFIKKYLNKKKQKVFIVHRLDRDTSGILVFAKSEKMKNLLQKYWNDITIKRGYLAIIEGEIKPESGVIRNYLKEEKNTMVHSTPNSKNGKLAITRYETKRKNSKFSLLEIFLETGRKNQIRVHLSEAGHPIIGDKKYHANTDPIHRLGLHAHILTLIHPITKKTLSFQAAVPDEFLPLFKK